MTDNKYNGWTNRETWLVNIWFLDGFGSEDFDDTRDPYTLGEILKDHVQEHLDASDVPDVWLDFICLASVDWYELGEHLINDWYS